MCAREASCAPLLPSVSLRHVCVIVPLARRRALSALILMYCSENITREARGGVSPLLTTEMIKYVCYMLTHGLKWCYRLNQL